MFVVVGHSEDPDAEGAVEEIVEQCEEQLDGLTPKAGVLFASVDLDGQELVSGICRAFEGIDLVGCTSDGEISSETGYADGSATLILFGANDVDITAGVGRDMSGDVNAACQRALEMARAKTDKNPTLCITTPDSLTASSQGLVQALVDDLGPDVPLFGATAGDHFRFEGTQQFFGDEVLSNAVPVLLFSGPLTYSFGVDSGWEPVGQPGTVTGSAGTMVQTIDGQPAIEFYRKYLGADGMPSGEIPLALLDDDDNVMCLRATPGVIDEETGAVACFADVDEGSRVMLTAADRDAILVGSKSSLDVALSNFPEGKDVSGALFFSCAGRKMILGTRTKEEYDLISSTLGDDVPVCGFYGYGEIGPLKGSEAGSRFHNETFVTLLLGK